MNEPRPELERISYQLDLPLIDAEVESFEREFLDNGLRHTRFTSQDLDLLQTLPRQTKALFSALDDAIQSRLPSDNERLSTAVANARAYLDDIAPLLRYEWQLDRRVRSAQQSAHACNEALQERIRISESLTSTVESLRNVMRVSEQQQQTLEEMLQSTQTQFEAARKELTSSEAATAALRAEIRNLRNSQAEILGSTSWRITTPLRVAGRLLKRA
ncbi:hypothetical protein BTK97_003367 [Burkholderia multivorans]|nr:hypothetical protein [Burkholderia multivorans]